MCLQWRHVLVGHAPSEQLPQQDAEGEDVRLLAIRLVLDDLWCHPPAQRQRPLSSGCRAKLICKACGILQGFCPRSDLMQLADASAAAATSFGPSK